MTVEQFRKLAEDYGYYATVNGAHEEAAQEQLDALVNAYAAALAAKEAAERERDEARVPCRGCAGADTAPARWARCYNCRQRDAGHEERADALEADLAACRQRAEAAEAVVRRLVESAALYEDVDDHFSYCDGCNTKYNLLNGDKHLHVDDCPVVAARRLAEQSTARAEGGEPA